MNTQSSPSDESPSENKVLAFNNKSGNNKNGRRCRTNRSPEETAQMKFKFPCHECWNFGHWAKDHRSDGSLRQGAVRSVTPINACASQSVTASDENNGSKKVMIGYNSTFCTVEDTIPCNSAVAETSNYNIGPIVDDGAAYSAMGEIELRLLQIRSPSENYRLEPNPQGLTQYTY